MNLLLDTHILLWLLARRERLSANAMDLIENSTNQTYASTLSVIEVAIKHSLGRERPNHLPLSGTDFSFALEEAGVPVLDVRPSHAAALDDLPKIHGDPFDRLLVATAQVESMVLVTKDRTLARYGANVRLV